MEKHSSRRDTTRFDNDNASIAPSMADSTAPLMPNSGAGVKLGGKGLFARLLAGKDASRGGGDARTKQKQKEQPAPVPAQASTSIPVTTPSGAKDYEAAFGALSSGLGWGGGIPVKNPKKGDSKAPKR